MCRWFCQLRRQLFVSDSHFQTKPILDKDKRIIEKHTLHFRINQSNHGRWNRSRSVILTRNVRKRDNRDRCCHKPSPIRHFPRPGALAYLAGRINRIVWLGTHFLWPISPIRAGLMLHAIRPHTIRLAENFEYQSRQWWRESIGKLACLIQVK
jgi:hypothetical protein